MTSEIYYKAFKYIRIYEKRPFSIRFQKKDFSSAGARTHESETRPEEIDGNESLGEIEL